MVIYLIIIIQYNWFYFTVDVGENHSQGKNKLCCLAIYSNITTINLIKILFVDEQDLLRYGKQVDNINYFFRVRNPGP